MANPLQFMSQQPVFTETLLRFPFANFLANPCGFMATPPTSNPSSAAPAEGERGTTPSSASSGDDYLLSPLRLMATDEPISQQTLKFIEPIRERYAHRNYTAEERANSIQELSLVLQESKHLNHHIFPASVS